MSNMSWKSQERVKPKMKYKLAERERERGVSRGIFPGDMEVGKGALWPSTVQSSLFFSLSRIEQSGKTN